MDTGRHAWHGDAILAFAKSRVLADGGFLARNLESAQATLDDPKLSEIQKEEVRIFIATMQEQDVLRPQGAVTDADLWLFDRTSGIAVIGDLVTLPAPFFETACPDDWRRSLDAVWATPFRTAIPGHGDPMGRAQFDAWADAATLRSRPGTRAAGKGGGSAGR